jgi:hypothetical protein
VFRISLIKKREHFNMRNLIDWKGPWPVLAAYFDNRIFPGQKLLLNEEYYVVDCSPNKVYIGYDFCDVVYKGDLLVVDCFVCGIQTVNTSTEPSCVCPFCLHTPDCAWLNWKRGKQ